MSHWPPCFYTAGISFVGVIAFIFADLIIISDPQHLPQVPRAAGHGGPLVVSPLTMAVSGLVIGLLFNAADLTPTNRHIRVFDSGISWDYSTLLNIAFLVGMAVLLFHPAGRERRFGTRMRNCRAKPRNSPART